jgi:tRNA(Ile2)-agmatinylcytidine synthase
MWIGIDDTDSRNGGCTTYLAFILIQKLISNGFDIINYPCLVRLNPNVPWKTRGNGAISFNVGFGSGKSFIVGECDSKSIYSYKKSLKSLDEDDIQKITEIIEYVFSEYAYIDDENTNPGYVLMENKPSYDLYYKAVREIISLDEIINELKSLNALFKGFKNKRGLIGATAATAWSNKNDNTFEIITYRPENKRGSIRFIEKESVIKMDKKYSSTFDNYDYKNDYICISPNSPCPILFGIRGNNSNDLSNCIKIINSEEFIGWMIFNSNQGTDDHLVRKKISSINPYQSVIVRGIISKKPVRNIGGHVIFSIRDSKGGLIDCAAYEPTKNFRDIIQMLHVGDEIEVYGGIRSDPLTINIEKIKILNLVEIIEKVENPICPKCNKHMKSKGKNQGFKCKNCGISSDECIVKMIPRNINPGFYEVPSCARRHLSKPLKRMK